jgi:molybdopterin-guanine dinucleotide biosynthesis protein A
MLPKANNQSMTTGSHHKVCSAAILAGGASSRMGANKALMHFHGEPLITRVAKALAACPAISEILLITNTPAEYAFLYLPCFPDIQPGKGPLGGIYTALTHAKFSRALVVACDLPFITPELLDYLCREGEGAEVCVLESDKGVEPLCAVYAKSCLPVIEKQLRNGRLKVSDFYPQVDTKIIRLDASLPFYKPHLLANVNTPEEFAAMKKKDG